MIISKKDVEILDLTDFQKEELGLLASNDAEVSAHMESAQTDQELIDAAWWSEFVLGG